MIWLALAFPSLRQTESSYSAPAPVRFSRLLKPGWGFVERSVASGDVLLGDHLYMRRLDFPDRLALVKSMSDLRDHVRISSDRDALMLVRMRTYAEFGSTFIPLSDWMEISHGPGGNEGWFGGITDARWRRAKLHEPRVKRLSRGWVIERAIVDFEKQPSGEPFLVTETASVDGRYAVVSKRRLHRRALRGVFWQSAVVAE